VKERGSRTIFLADCQSFYTSVEKADNPAYQHKSGVQ
jgi:nucleotidyltransferase/DNA polymerase involved in DNA repair